MIKKLIFILVLIPTLASAQTLDTLEINDGIFPQWFDKINDVVLEVNVLSGTPSFIGWPEDTGSAASIGYFDFHKGLITRFDRYGSNAIYSNPRLWNDPEAFDTANSNDFINITLDSGPWADSKLDLDNTVLLGFNILQDAYTAGIYIGDAIYIGNGAVYTQDGDSYGDVSIGSWSMYSYQGGEPNDQQNTAIGTGSASDIEHGRSNVFIGADAGEWHQFGSYNTWLGPKTGVEGSWGTADSSTNNTAVGYGAKIKINTQNSTAIGYNSRSRQNNLVSIGDSANSKVVLGGAFNSTTSRVLINDGLQVDDLTVTGTVTGISSGGGIEIDTTYSLDNPPEDGTAWYGDTMRVRVIEHNLPSMHGVHDPRSGNNPLAAQKYGSKTYKIKCGFVYADTLFSDIIADSANGCYITGVSMRLVANYNPASAGTFQFADVHVVFRHTNLVNLLSMDFDQRTDPNISTSNATLTPMFYSENNRLPEYSRRVINGHLATYWYPLAFDQFLNDEHYWEGEVTIYYGQELNQTGGFGVKWINL